MNIRSFLHKLWKDDKGQSTTEYILILSVVVMMAVQFKKTFQQQLRTMLDSLDKNLSKAIDDNNN